MKNKEILRDRLSQNINGLELEYYNSIYEKLREEFEKNIKERIKKIKEVHDIDEISYKFDIKTDFMERNMDLIISNSNHWSYLNLFKFIIITNKFNEDIKNYIFNDNILQLAEIQNIDKKIIFDLKSEITRELLLITEKMDNKVLFNIFTAINLYELDFFNNNKSLINIHFERCITSDKSKFDKLLNDFSFKNNCSILYIPNEIIFGSSLEKLLDPKNFTEIKKIRDKNGMCYAIFYSDIKDNDLSSLVHKAFIKYSMFPNSTGFGFNNA